MAISTFMGLETTLRGLLAAQRALDTTGHNVANANTIGYTREVADLEATPAFSPPGEPGQIGTGVDVAQYERIRDDFLDVQVRAQTMRKGYADSSNSGLNQVELALNEPSDSGLKSLLGKYWASWQDLANAPENVATRQALAQNASALASGFNSLSSQLSTIQAQTAQNVTDTLSQVNSIGQQIAGLTQSITDQESVGNQPNDLLDQRDVLIDQLSQMANISVTQGALGSVTISIGGAAFVTGAVSDTMTEAGGVFTMTTSAATASVTSGNLAGLVNLRDTTIPGYLTQLDTLASTLINATNAQSALGFDLNGNPGGQFFAGTDAATIAVDPAILANVSTIAAASAAGVPGDSSNALAIANLSTTPLIGPATIDTAYSALVTQIGSDARDAKQMLDNATALTNSIENNRQSVSGVSLDEEMANMTRFQRGFQASSRALTAMDDMIDQLINRTGKVGL